MADNKDVKNLENTDIDSILIIREHGESQEYSVSNSNITFDVSIADGGSLVITGGQIVTPYFIQNSELDYVRTWRYTVMGVTITGFHVNARENTITYTFEAQDFADMTLEDETDGKE